MHRSRRVCLVVVGAIVVGCGQGSVGTPANSVAPTTPAGTSAALPTAVPTMGALPSDTSVQTQVIDLPGSTGLIFLTTDGTTVWASSNDAVLRIDADTSHVTSLSAPSKSDDTTLQIAADGLWMTRWEGGHVYRLDPASGKVELSVELESAVRLALVGDDLWIGRESTSEMLLMDRTTGAISRAIKESGYGVSGLGDLWFTIGSSVRRVDPATGAVKATIEVQREGNCSVYGAFPANAWVTCFGKEVVARAATRLETTSDTIATSAALPPCHGGSIVVIAGEPWFLGTFEDAAGQPIGALLRLHPGTGAIEQYVSLGGADPDPAVVAGGALWIGDEANHRILRVELADLAG